MTDQEFFARRIKVSHLPEVGDVNLTILAVAVSYVGKTIPLSSIFRTLTRSFPLVDFGATEACHCALFGCLERNHGVVFYETCSISGGVATLKAHELVRFDLVEEGDQKS